MVEVFRYQWRASHYHGAPVSDLWLALGSDDGDWWVDTYYIGRFPLSGGSAQATAFARWLLEDPAPDRYEKEFLLVDAPAPGLGKGWRVNGESVQVENTRLTLDCLLGREEAGGPEYLILMPSGHSPRYGFEICADLECETLDRSQLASAAAELLAAAQTT